MLCRVCDSHWVGNPYGSWTHRDRCLSSTYHEKKVPISDSAKAEKEKNTYIDALDRRTVPNEIK